MLCRLLRQGSCAFSRLYSSFHESLFSAKLYLTAALHSPIMQLLMMEEKYLDVDPEKIALRYSYVLFVNLANSLNELYRDVRDYRNRPKRQTDGIL